MSARRVTEVSASDNTPAEELELGLLRLPGIVKRLSRWGNGTAFYVGTREVVHFHGPKEVDIRLTRERTREYRSARPHDSRLRFRHSGSDWVAVRVEKSGDVAFALELCEEALRANQ